MKRLISPKIAAQALGASESSLKRWCDRELIPTSRTAGGHRRILAADLLRFARERGESIPRPELLGLPRSLRSIGGSAELETQLESALLEGDEATARGLLIHAHLEGRSVRDLGDSLLRTVLTRLGAGWQTGDVEVYQEHRATEIVLRALTDLRELLPAPAADAPMAIGATPQGERYSITGQLVALSLRELGWAADFIGPDHPVETLCRAIGDIRPRLFFFSATHLGADEESFLRDFETLSTHCREHGVALVVGGQALSKALRLRMTYAAYCETLEQLAAFTEVL